MFENDIDFDFDDKSLDSSFKVPEKSNTNKRPLIDLSSKDRPKKNKTQESIFVRPRLGPKPAVKRKFPGPAGILPDCGDLDPSVIDSLHQNSTNASDNIPCTQSSLAQFQNGPWAQMTEDYPILSGKYNISWIKNNATANKLFNQKAPFLAAVIHNIECFDAKLPIVNVVLKDMTGEIQGTVIYSLYEKYSDYLLIGSVIVLKHFGVLTTGTGNNKNHLTITHNNLAGIYTAIESDKENVEEVKKVVLSGLPDDEVALELLYYKEPEDDQLQIKNISAREIPKFSPSSDKRTSVTHSVISDTNINISVVSNNANFDSVPKKAATGSAQKKFQFKTKKPDKNIANLGAVSSVMTVGCTQVLVRTNQEHSEIWQDALDGVDADSLFDDF